MRSSSGCHKILSVTQHRHDAGLNLAKLALIWVAVSMAVYRCRQECEPGAFASIEQHVYRFQWYLRLFAASVIMYGTVLAALSGVKSSAAEHAPASASTNAAGTTQDGAHVGEKAGLSSGKCNSITLHKCFEQHSEWCSWGKDTASKCICPSGGSRQSSEWCSWVEGHSL